MSAYVSAFMESAKENWCERRMVARRVSPVADACVLPTAFPNSPSKSWDGELFEQRVCIRHTAPLTFLSLRLSLRCCAAHHLLLGVASKHLILLLILAVVSLEQLFSVIIQFDTFLFVFFLCIRGALRQHFLFSS